jgi:WhiB family redox-sensing transcriptional regulator
VLVRSVPLDGGAISPDQLGGDPVTGLGSLLDAAPRAGLDLPCRSGDADLWFAECLAGAVRREEPWGVWGGEIFLRGAVIPRKRPRGRPSKAALARDREYAAAVSA